MQSSKHWLSKMPKDLNEDLHSIKKFQSEINTLIEIRTIYRESTVEWMKPRIKSMIWNIRKQKSTIQNNKKKKESKQMSIVKESLGQLKRSNTLIIWVPEEKRYSKKLEIYLEK